jgi:hypothetical protein
MKGDPPGGAGQVLGHCHHVMAIGVQQSVGVRHHAHMPGPEHQVAALEIAEILGQRYSFPVLFRPGFLLSGIARMKRPAASMAVWIKPEQSSPRLSLPPHR